MPLPARKAQAGRSFPPPAGDAAETAPPSRPIPGPLAREEAAASVVVPVSPEEPAHHDEDCKRDDNRCENDEGGRLITVRREHVHHDAPRLRPLDLSQWSREPQTRGNGKEAHVEWSPDERRASSDRGLEALQKGVLSAMTAAQREALSR
jgi:hypothetical protein